MVAVDAADPIEVYGSIMCEALKADGKTGALGMLAVDQGQLKKGYGKLLIDGAEARALSKGAEKMELELLAPRDTKHPVKEWLHIWYSKLGYVKGEQKEFADDYPEFAKLLSEPCTFTVYTKDLKKSEAA